MVGPVTPASALLARVTLADAEHLGVLLGFRPPVAAHFEAQTRDDRARHLQRTSLIGLLLYNIYNISDWFLMPDLQWLAPVLRLLVVTPVALALMWLAPRVNANLRERNTLIGSVGAAAVPILLLWTSTAPTAVYTASECLLVMMYATMMLVLRFSDAIVFVVITAALAIASYFLKAGNSTELAGALTLQMLAASVFLVYGNYRLEYMVRSSYLKALRETLRSQNLQVDNAALEALSLVDPLTGVGNRRRFAERLAGWSRTGTPAGQSMGLVMVDVDHFKRYNDHYGHPAGDACLQRLATAMRASLRDDRDVLARYGGEEFAALLPDADMPSLMQAAQRLCDAVQALGLPHEHRGDGHRVVTISAGVALSTANAPCNERALLAAADAALYEAKRLGRNRVASAPAEPVVTERRSRPAPLPT